MVDRDGKRAVGLIDGTVGEDGELLEGLRQRGWDEGRGGGGVGAELSVVGDGPGDRLADYQDQLHAGVHCFYSFWDLKTKYGGINFWEASKSSQNKKERFDLKTVKFWYLPASQIQLLHQKD